MPLVMRGIIFAAVAQSVERILGKDEVTSSNLVSSSKKACDRNDHRLFCFVHYSPIASFGANLGSLAISITSAKQSITSAAFASAEEIT